MHETALVSGNAFSKIYGGPGKTVVDIGGLDVNGSLRAYFVEKGMNYICIDMAEHSSVDIVVKPGEKLPFDNGSIDIVVSSSCFEHDPCFWLTFKEITRIVKLDGFIYVSAPTNGPYHCYPGDNWRFYSDAGQALAYWSGVQMGNEEVFPVRVIETFHMAPHNDVWIDFVCVWKRVLEKEKEICVSPTIAYMTGEMQKEIHNSGYKTYNKC